MPGMTIFKPGAFIADDDGATSIEYALIVAIVSISIITGLTLIRGELQNVFVQVVSGFQGATN